MDEHDSVLGISLTPEQFDGEQIYALMPPVWGNPFSVGYDARYVGKIVFMGKVLSWHKWAIIPIMNTQDDLLAGGWAKKYHWEDLQTWNKRMIAGTNIISNHSYPTAIDINPAQNPMRYDNVLVTDIPVGVRLCFKAHHFGWGGNYKSVKDAMHFEYTWEPRTQLDELFGYPTSFITGTKTFQAKNKLTADGIIGAKTWAVIKSYIY